MVRFDVGTIVEVCPVIILNADFKRLSRDVQLKVFDWNDLTGRGPNFHALALGYGSMYNGANPANLRYDALPEGPYLQLSTVRTIEIGEELTINYSGKQGSHESQGNPWFMGNEVRFVQE